MALVVGGLAITRVWDSKWTRRRHDGQWRLLFLALLKGRIRNGSGRSRHGPDVRLSSTARVTQGLNPTRLLVFVRLCKRTLFIFFSHVEIISEEKKTTALDQAWSGRVNRTKKETKQKWRIERIWETEKGKNSQYYHTHVLKASEKAEGAWCDWLRLRRWPRTKE